MRNSSLGWCLFVLAVCNLGASAGANEQVAFEKLTLTEEFHSEGIAVGDIDGDGISDVVSGPFWYPGPKFKQRFRYLGHQSNDQRSAADRALSIKGYSDHFFTWVYDFNADGHLDILAVGMPGEAAFWFENPGAAQNSHQNWVKRKAYDDISNESPAFVDITGDGKPELVCLHQGAYAYIQHQAAEGQVTFAHTPISKNLRYGRFTHGLGLGDVDLDGKMDLLETNGWWQQQDPGELFQFHPFRFAAGGGAQMFAYDFDGDGDNDVICSQNAHGYGLKWFEQVSSGEKIDFVSHSIMSDRPQDNPFGLAVSQLHAAALADMDGDGIKDLITGKRYWAHGGADPGSKQLPLLFWLKTIRRNDRVIFEPQLIDVRSGVGTQVTVQDINGDGQPDVAVGNKLGSYLFIQNKNAVASKWEDQPLKAGTKLFYENIRTSQPLSPQDQQKTFVLPQGFEIQLVASEPDIAKPMNLAFDSQGRLWVSSSREYPFPAKAGTKPRDAIKILEDTDQDGKADKVTTFADGLNIPMGLLPYGDGVICFSIPNIWYLRDTDGDDKADKREILYGPFDTTRDTHGMCSSFRMGNDGWVYACHGFNNQSTVKGRDGHEVTMHSGNTFRFRPDGSRIEVVGRGQVNPFGMTIDSYGDIFTADCHTKPINLVLPGGHHDSFGKPHDGLGYVPNVLEHLHDSTGIGGVVLGENTAFPTVYQRSTFGGNVVTGRVNRNHLVYRGSSMTAREESDFVIPGDPWFRPVNLQVGPDGALYIADFYNRIIGHYEVDLNHPGRDRERGRIWKVVYRGDPNRLDKLTPRTKQASSKVNNLEAIAIELKTANQSRSNAIVSWLIREAKRDANILPKFVRLVQQADDESNGNALYWTIVMLKRSNVISSQLVKTFLASDHEKVRCLAQQLLAEFKPDDFATSELESALINGLKDPSPFVQRFAALSAAKQPSVNTVNELIELLGKAPTQSDRYLVHAIKIALRDQFRFDNKRLIAARSKVQASSLGQFADVCMSIQSPEAAGFIIQHLEQLAAKNPSKLTAYLEFSARHADEKSIDSIVEIAEQKFASDQKFQLAILDSLRVGIQQRQRSMPGSIKNLASRIASHSMRLPAKNWQPIQAGKTVSFGARQLKTAEGKTKFFIDTLSRGESATGVLRSSPFRLKDQFKFQLAGHDGKDPAGNKRNFLKLQLADGQELSRQFVRSSDTPTQVSIPTKEHAGKLAYVEIVDGSDLDAYAWIAVGDFTSHPELNANATWNVDPEVDALSWTYFKNESSKTSSGENIFVLTTRRSSTDGMQETPLWSSIVKGEQRTGVFRSEPFELEKSFSFYLAGHDGYPDKPINKLNYVQLKLASSGQIIHKVFPPRHDTAHPIKWDTKRWSGQKAFVEIVDQDTAGAFAWLAAGRFSVKGLNPSRKSGDRLLASQIISRFQLDNLKPDILRLIKTTKSLNLKSELAKTLIQLSNQQLTSRSLFEVAADLIAFAKSDAQTVDMAVECIQKANPDLAKKLATNMLKKMSVAEQARIADRLSSDRIGASFLVESIDSGLVATSVLSQPALVAKLKAHNLKELSQRIDQLSQQIPEIDEAILKAIADRKKLFSSRKINIANGKTVFEKNCGNCHQIAGAGKQVGPNLDGVGNRGLERLVDDILLPNRNVDAAFRATLVATVDGRVVNGLVKKGNESDKTISLVDNTGKITLIPIADIEDRKETKGSPMPANFADTIPPADFADLIGYLLSIR